MKIVFIDTNIKFTTVITIIHKIYRYNPPYSDIPLKDSINSIFRRNTLTTHLPFIHERVVGNLVNDFAVIRNRIAIVSALTHTNTY